MKRLIILILSIFMICFCGCANNGEDTAKCVNGSFTGVYEEDTEVLSFKGIPYAKAPVGDLRWKAPESVEPSDETFTADKFGNSAIQYYWFSEPITTEVSEDCLTLNVWTKDLETEDKPVMVYFHGGSFAWGGSSEEIYDGQYIVDEHNDVIVVTVNYRLGMMGFIDFSGVEGGEEFSDSRELGLLDCVESLKWIKNNIEAFGGDPDNVTIFGESAGATIAGCLLASDYAGELFQRVIAQSGNLRLTYDEEGFEESSMTDVLMAVSGAENMDDLMALSTEELIEINEKALDEDETCINDLYNLPLRGGKVVKEDMYGALEDASEKGVDLLIGTNADEQNYWIVEMGTKPIAELSEEEINTNLSYFEDYYISSMYKTACGNYSAEEKEKAKKYLEMNSDKGELWAKAGLLTETAYRIPAIRMAESHSDGGKGNTYMYLYEKKNDSNEYLGACHSAELTYVFHTPYETGVYGTYDEKLADDICDAWVSFAKTGDPGSGSIKWEKYDRGNRNTMIIGDDSSFKIEKDPLKDARLLLDWKADKKVHSNGA